MKRLALVFLAAAVVGLFVATAGGEVLSSGEDRISNEIVAEPHPGPNGNYASVDNETGNLTVDLTASNDNVDGDGVNPEALTGVDDVFVLNYTGEEFAHVWLEHDSENVTFYAGGDTSNVLEGERNNVSLSSGDTVGVGFVVDSRDSEVIDRLIEEVQINANVPDDDDEDTDDRTDSSVAPPADPCPPSPTVDVKAQKKTTQIVSISDVDPCHTETIDLLDPTVGHGITLTELEVDFDTSQDHSLEVGSEQQVKPGAVDEPGVVPLGRVAIDGPADTAEHVAYTFEGNVSRLEGEGIDPEEVSVYGPDGKTEYDLERTAANGTVTYVVTDTDLSAYTIAAETQSADVSDPDHEEGIDPTDDPEERSDPVGTVVVVGIIAALILGMLAARAVRD